jgi:hypothetical protein
MDINLKQNTKSNESSAIFIFIIIVIVILFIYFWMNNTSSNNNKTENFKSMNTRNMMQSSNINNSQLRVPSEMRMNQPKMQMNQSEMQMNQPKMQMTQSEMQMNQPEINIIDDYKTNESELASQNNMTSDNMNVTNNVSNNVLNNPVNNLTNDNNVDISGFINGEQSCNMNKMQQELVSDYKKKYFKMYRHQIECPKECGLYNKGYNSTQTNCPFNDMKRCNLSENNDCQGIVSSDYNNPDVFSLGFLALDNNNNKNCVSCISNDYRQTANMKLPSYISNEDNDVEVNRRRLDNRNKFADFNNYIEQNGVMETSVDKLAEIRTCTNGTCGLESFGRKVSDVYDNLLSTTYTTNKKNCNPGMISGVLEDASMTSSAQPLNSQF